MLEIVTVTIPNGASAKLAPGGTVECLLSERMIINVIGINGLALVSGPDGGVSLEDAALTFTRAGRYRFKVSTLALGIADFHVVACEDGCLARLPDGDQPRGGVSDRRHILRALAAHATFFNGLASELVGQPLAQFGG
jgi:hypothetical protein